MSGPQWAHNITRDQWIAMVEKRDARIADLEDERRQHITLIGQLRYAIKNHDADHPLVRAAADAMSETS